MYICICNALTENSVRATARSEGGGTSPGKVYHRLGCAPQCGMCLKRAREIVREEMQTLSLARTAG